MAIDQRLTISAQEQQMQGTASRVATLYDTLGKLSEEAARRRTATFVTSDEEIRFDRVQVVTPSGVQLVRDLSFSVPVGGNLLLTGHNGAGKSSIFRVLGGLWPSAQGTVCKPSDANVVYLPQKPSQKAYQ